MAWCIWITCNYSHLQSQRYVLEFHKIQMNHKKSETNCEAKLTLSVIKVFVFQNLCVVQYLKNVYGRRIIYNIKILLTKNWNLFLYTQSITLQFAWSFAEVITTTLLVCTRQKLYVFCRKIYICVFIQLKCSKTNVATHVLRNLLA